MKQQRRHIDDVFAGARQVQPQESLFSAADLRAIVASSAPDGVRRTPTFLSSRVRTSIVLGGLLLTSIAAGVFVTRTPEPSATAPVVVDRTLTPPPAPEPEGTALPDAGNSAPAATAVPDSTALSAAPPERAVVQGTDDAEQVAGQRRSRPALSPPAKIRGLRFLELNDEELTRLGIVRTETGYGLYAQEIMRYDDREARQHMTFTRSSSNSSVHNVSVRIDRTRLKELYASAFGGDTTEPVATLKYKVLLDTFEVNGTAIRYPAASTVNPTVSPLIISHDYYRSATDQGRFVVTFENPMVLDSTSKFSRQVFEMFNAFADESSLECRDFTQYSLLSKLVPVYIRMGKDKEKGRKTSGSDIILWYYPTPEFLDALPQHLADKLRIELGFTTLVEEGVLHAEELKQRYCGEYNYLDVCRAKDGAISITSVAPNPATDRAVVRVHVAAQRNFTVSLHDMFGNRVAHLSNVQLLDSDMLTIDVSDKPAGTYLIAITSDKGEQVVERLIVSR